MSNQEELQPWHAPRLRFTSDDESSALFSVQASHQVPAGRRSLLYSTNSVPHFYKGPLGGVNLTKVLHNVKEGHDNSADLASQESRPYCAVHNGTMSSSCPRPPLDRKRGGRLLEQCTKQTGFLSHFFSLCIMMMPVGQMIHLKAVFCSGT